MSPASSVTTLTSLPQDSPFQSLPGQQLPTVAVPAAPSRGQEPQSPQRVINRQRVVPCWLSWRPSASERKKGGNSVLGAPSPDSPCFEPRLQPFSQTQLGSWELSRSVPTQTQLKDGFVLPTGPGAPGRQREGVLRTQHGPRRSAHPRATARCLLMNECGGRRGTSPLPEQPLHAEKGGSALRVQWDPVKQFPSQPLVGYQLAGDITLSSPDRIQCGAHCAWTPGLGPCTPWES